LLVVGDVVKVINGSTIPVDGVVVKGDGLVNESMLTGEAKPVHKQGSSKVFGGTMLIRGTILVRVTRAAELSAVNQIMKLVESAQSAKAPIQGMADKISRYFVPTIVLLALLSWTFWFSFAYSEYGRTVLYLGGQTRFIFAFNFGVSTLVIACPCALGLATPTAVMVGTGIAASFGCLIKGGDVLENINRITMVVFDKTGTLTAGTPQVKDLVDVLKKFKPNQVEAYAGKAIQPYSLDELLSILYLCEATSEHPLAEAMVAKAKSVYRDVDTDKKFKLCKFKNINGEGVVTEIACSDLGESETGATNKPESERASFQVLCGNDKLMARFGIYLKFNNFHLNLQSLEQEGKTVVCMVVAGVPRLLISLEEDHLTKPEALGVVTYLREVLKMRVAMITGDNQHAAMKVAHHLEIPPSLVTYRAYPKDKKLAV